MDYRYDNVITLRTFSKAYGLSGIRVGYGFAHEDLIENLSKVKLPFEPNLIGQLGAIGALEDQPHLERTLRNNLKRYKEAMGYCKINFDGNKFSSEQDDEDSGIELASEHSCMQENKSTKTEANGSDSYSGATAVADSTTNSNCPKSTSLEPYFQWPKMLYSNGHRIRSSSLDTQLPVLGDDDHGHRSRYQVSSVQTSQKMEFCRKRSCDDKLLSATGKVR